MIQYLKPQYKSLNGNNVFSLHQYKEPQPLLQWELQTSFQRRNLQEKYLHR